MFKEERNYHMMGGDCKYPDDDSATPELPDDLKWHKKTR
jgi:hypothetical protein